MLCLALVFAAAGFPAAAAPHDHRHCLTHIAAAQPHAHHGVTAADAPSRTQDGAQASRHKHASPAVQADTAHCCSGMCSAVIMPARLAVERGAARAVSRPHRPDTALASRPLDGPTRPPRTTDIAS